MMIVYHLNASTPRDQTDRFPSSLKFNNWILSMQCYKFNDFGPLMAQPYTSSVLVQVLKLYHPLMPFKFSIHPQSTFQFSNTFFLNTAQKNMLLFNLQSWMMRVPRMITSHLHQCHVLLIPKQQVPMCPSFYSTSHILLHYSLGQNYAMCIILRHNWK